MVRYYLQASTFFCVLLETHLSSVIIVMSNWIQGFAWQRCIYSLFINNKAHCFLLGVLFSCFLLSFFEELQARRNIFYWIFWVTCHIWLPPSMLVPIDIWVVAQSKTAMTEQHILIHHLVNVKRAAVCGADNQRTLVFKERITFRQPCLLFLEGVRWECSY